MSDSVKSDLQIYLEQIKETPLLTREEEVELCRKIQADGCAVSRERMIKSNLRLVVSIAKHYNNRGLALQDLIEEGNIGLLKAVEAFDPEVGARFSTYASWWIKQGMRRSLIGARQPVHIPAYMIELIGKWRRAFPVLQEELGRPPTNQEMAHHLELPLKKVRIIRKAVQALKSTGQASDDEGSTLAETLEDERTPTPAQNLLNADEIATIRELLEVIDKREAVILQLRFGLDGDEPLTLKEIGRLMGLTRERVRQVETDALRKLNRRMNSDDPFSDVHDSARRRRGDMPSASFQEAVRKKQDEAGGG